MKHLIITGTWVLLFAVSLPSQTHAAPQNGWYPSVRAKAGTYEVWLANPATGKERRIAQGLRSRKAAVDRAKTAFITSNQRALRRVKQAASFVRHICREVAQLNCDLCGQKSSICRTLKSSSDELYYTIFGHDECASLAIGLRNDRRYPSAWKQRKRLMCKEAPAKAGKASTGDCDVAAQIMCDTCGRQSATCRGIRKWVRQERPNALECKQYRQGMEQSKVVLDGLPAPMRREKTREMCTSMASDMNAAGY